MNKMRLLVGWSGLFALTVLLHKKSFRKIIALRGLQHQCDKLPPLTLWMDIHEITAFRELVQDPENINKTYFEWGTGGSTSIVPFWFGRSFSVENDPAWCDHMMTSPIVACLTQQKNLDFHCIVPTTELTKFGRPARPEDEEKFSSYYGAMDAIVKAENAAGRPLPHFDVVLIDGRFRVECAMAALDYMNEDSILLMHDFERVSYHVVLEVLERARPDVGRFAFLKRKKDYNKEVINQIIESHIHDYS